MSWKDKFPKEKRYFETERGILYCGDCLEIMKKIPEKNIDLVLTDPPYGINIAKDGTVGVERKAKLTNYGKQTWDFAPPNKEVFDTMLRISKKSIIFGGNYFTDKLPVSKCWLCWDKKIPKNFTKAQIELMWTNMTTYSRIYSVLWHGMIRERYRGDEQRFHPTQKPVKLICDLLRDFSANNSLILDPFIGSGTTAVACEQLNRRWIGIEINEEYCEITKKRISVEVRQKKLW